MSTPQSDDVVADRVAGLRYSAMSAKYGKPIWWLRRICVRAFEQGRVTAAQIKYKPATVKRVLIPDADYTPRWIARVKNGCIIDERGCWLWQGTLGLTGYGQTNYRGQTTTIHRVMYKLVNKIELSKKQYVCHHCDVRNCCNPEHMFVGTQFDNMADSVRKGRHAEQLVTECPHGHPYDAENTYIVNKPNGKTSRHCKMCSRARGRIRAGWPEHLAYSMPAVAHGQRPVNAPFRRARSQS